MQLCYISGGGTISSFLIFHLNESLICHRPLPTNYKMFGKHVERNAHSDSDKAPDTRQPHWQIPHVNNDLNVSLFHTQCQFETTSAKETTWYQKLPCNLKVGTKNLETICIAIYIQSWRSVTPWM